MAPTAAAPNARCRLPFAFPLLLLLLAGPAQGNEGGAAGSCRCIKVSTPPKFLDRLESCDTCRDFTRFNFPNRRLCALNDEAWLLELKRSVCGQGRPGEAAGRAEASRGHPSPAPSSQAPGPTPASPSSAGGSPDKSPETPWAAETSTGVAWVPAMAGSPPAPSAEAAAREAGQAPPEEEQAAPPPALDAKVFVVIPVLAGVGGVVAFLVCRSRRRERSGSWAGRRPPAPLGEGEGTSCLPGENT